MTLAIIQARMTSKRLPGKVMADLGGKPLLHYMVDRVRSSKMLHNIVVATTTNAADDPVTELCGNLDVDVFRGSEQDVLGRFFEASQLYPDNLIVRLTADCPLIDAALIDAVVLMFGDGAYDYVSNTVDRTFPDGLDVEAFSKRTLEITHDLACRSEEREHVTPFMIEGGAASAPFRVGQYRFAADFGHLRWTVDTPQDLDRIRKLEARLAGEFTWLDALAEATKDPSLLGTQA
ncbi:MAG: glycosyltransferase family protein [Alphaproteobacteria bacterium]|nr:glycosyltransferase family protein [Alphaproteobacteria bacterium]